MRTRKYREQENNEVKHLKTTCLSSRKQSELINWIAVNLHVNLGSKMHKETIQRLSTSEKELFRSQFTLYLKRFVESWRYLFSKGVGDHFSSFLLISSEQKKTSIKTSRRVSYLHVAKLSNRAYLCRYNHFSRGEQSVISGVLRPIRMSDYYINHNNYNFFKCDWCISVNGQLAVIEHL